MNNKMSKSEKEKQIRREAKATIILFLICFVECGLRLRPVRLQRPGTGAPPVVGAQHSGGVRNCRCGSNLLGAQSLRGL